MSGLIPGGSSAQHPVQSRASGQHLLFMEEWTPQKPGWGSPWCGPGALPGPRPSPSYLEALPHRPASIASVMGF